ncbi:MULTISPECIES: hypothetical protein [Streptomyces]|uniref:Uncharacterized protein n=1 Tax=Streptomyces yangpuensis TaxID=1648182 RepID=A0ABY5Q8G0_9ACTN|nr:MULTISPECIES: hypothetical protein [Streptomyces]UUY52534.1 hypothetical protein NRK68_35300 [Streptomyces yangpuensis]
MARWRVLPAGEFGDAEEDDPLELRQLPGRPDPSSAASSIAFSRRIERS